MLTCLPLGQGLFLDLDGTLANSLHVMRQVYEAFLRHYDRQGSDDEFNSLNGPPLQVVVGHLRHAHSLSPSLTDLTRHYRSLVAAAYETVDANPGARELLILATGLGWKIAVVTSNSEQIAADWLRRTELSDHVDIVVGRESVSKGKPHPLPYLLALERLHCTPARSLAIEDSRQGATAALAAGLRTFALGAPAMLEDWPAVSGAIARLDDLIPEVAHDRYP